MVVVSARAGVHGCCENQAGRVFDIAFNSGNADFPVFQRLAQYFKYISIELRQLIEE
jgi:hypothetical protein